MIRLKTYEQYYWGQKTGIQRAGVQYILDSVILELAKDPKKRFIYVETAFFWRWWYHQDDEMKNLVKQLVNQGKSFLFLVCFQFQNSNCYLNTCPIIIIIYQDIIKLVIIIIAIRQKQFTIKSLLRLYCR